jgi:hypothetical protein
VSAPRIVAIVKRSHYFKLAIKAHVSAPRQDFLAGGDRELPPVIRLRCAANDHAITALSHDDIADSPARAVEDMFDSSTSNFIGRVLLAGFHRRIWRPTGALTRLHARQQLGPSSVIQELDAVGAIPLRKFDEVRFSPWRLTSRRQCDFGDGWRLRTRCPHVRQDHAIESQQFAHRPSLKRTTLRQVRRLGVDNFRDVTEAGRL